MLKSATYPNNTFNSKDFFVSNLELRFHFNGKEIDNETQTQDYGYRIYDYRLSRFLSVDPMTKSYPMLTPYQFASNCPIAGIDLDGLEFYYTADNRLIGKIGKSTEVRIVQDKDVKNVQAYINWANNSKTPKYIQYANDQANKFSSAELAINPKEITSSKKPWYDLEGSDNGGNDRIVPGGPDAAGSTAGLDINFLGTQWGRSVSQIETEEGKTNYTTGKAGGQNNLGISIKGGPSLDFYWKTDVGKNEKVSNLLKGESSYIAVGDGVMVTLSWSKNADNRVTVYGLNVSLGAGFSAGKQFTEKVDSNLIRN